VYELGDMVHAIYKGVDGETDEMYPAEIVRVLKVMHHSIIYPTLELTLWGTKSGNVAVRFEDGESCIVSPTELIPRSTASV
jgi:hypothetical protein